MLRDSIPSRSAVATAARTTPSRLSRPLRGGPSARFIGTFVFSVPAAILYGPVLKAQYVLGSGADHRVFLGAFRSGSSTVGRAGSGRGSLCLVSATARRFAATTNGHTTKLTALLVVPEIAWEAFFAIYLTFKGFKQSPILGDRPVAVEEQRCAWPGRTAG